MSLKKEQSLKIVSFPLKMDSEKTTVDLNNALQKLTLKLKLQLINLTSFSKEQKPKFKLFLKVQLLK